MLSPLLEDVQIIEDWPQERKEVSETIISEIQALE